MPVPARENAPASSASPLRASLARLAHALSPTRAPAAPPRLSYFFVTGFGKSGTNWVGNLLNLHPRVRCDGEFHFQHFFHALEEFQRHDWQPGGREPVRSVARQGVESLVRRSLDAMGAAHPGVTHVGDRSPRPLRALLPDAKTIHIVRDGRDVVVSYTFHHLRAGEASHFPPRLRGPFERWQRAFRADPLAMNPDAPGLLGEEEWVREAARFWSWRVLQDLDASASMSEGDLLQMRYEELHADVASGARRMYEFLGVDPSLARAPSRESGTAPGFGREDRTSFYRKGEVGDWRLYASPPLTTWLREEMGEALVRLAYERDDSWAAAR